MLPRILVTGFKPFPGLNINPTEKLMNLVSVSTDQFPGVLIETRVFDTDYEACEHQLYDVIASFQPDAILSFGVSFTTDKIKLERIAVNFDNDQTPDNSGNQRRGRKIVGNGPDTYQVTTPVEEMYEALKDASIPVRVSNYAQTYVCNHLLYYGLHLIKTHNLKTRMGFIHVPLFPKQLKHKGNLRKGMDEKTLLEATRICVAVIASDIPRVATVGNVSYETLVSKVNAILDGDDVEPAQGKACP
jgi:pyroglutamyl-peptidase